MSNQLVDIYLADEPFWNGLWPDGRPGYAETPPIPQSRPGVDLVVPFINAGCQWSSTIGRILSKLEKGQQIARFFMAGHGGGGWFTLGQTLAWSDKPRFREFERLRPFTAEAITNVYIIGCEVAADAACRTVRAEDNGKPLTVCLGLFSGSTGMPGYQFLSQLARAINAPTHGTTWKLPIRMPWPDQLRGAPKVTVGPEGAWVYRGGFGNEPIRRGSP